MIQLNLLPDLKKEFITAQKAKNAVISVSILTTLAALGLSGLLFVYVTFVQQLQINVASDNIKREMQELKDIPDVDKYLTIQNQLKSLPELHNSKGINSRLISFLSVLNPSAPNSVSLSGLQMVNLDKTIVFTGTTASFETLNVFIDTLKNAQISYKIEGQGDPTTEKVFDQVRIQTSSLVNLANQGSVSFTVKAIYRGSVFAANNTDMVLTVPNITTTPSVTQSPKPVFNDKGSQ